MTGRKAVEVIGTRNIEVVFDNLLRQAQNRQELTRILSLA